MLCAGAGAGASSCLNAAVVGATNLPAFFPSDRGRGRLVMAFSIANYVR
jgi:hypothetical protein